MKLAASYPVHRWLLNLVGPLIEEEGPFRLRDGDSRQQATGSHGAHPTKTDYRESALIPTSSEHVESIRKFLVTLLARN